MAYVTNKQVIQITQEEEQAIKTVMNMVSNINYDSGEEFFGLRNEFLSDFLETIDGNNNNSILEWCQYFVEIID